MNRTCNSSLVAVVFVFVFVTLASPALRAQDESDAPEVPGVSDAFSTTPGEGTAPAESDLAATSDTAANPAPTFDEVHLTNGSLIIGEIVGMADGKLSIKTAFAVDEIVTVLWSDVAELRTSGRRAFLLADGTLLRGRVLRTEDGTLVIDAESVRGLSEIPLDAVGAIDPPPTKDVTLSGNLNLGVQIADGNTQTKAAGFIGEAVAKSERQRLTLRAAWNYAEDATSGITARNTRASIKYDFFLTERVFLFASALLEEDRFQDLSLRTALSAGPGYQFVKKGDFEEPWLTALEIYGEAGLAFFNEDFRVGMDQRYLAARWSIKVDWPLSERFTLFHYHEGYPGLENIRDLYILTQQGVRLRIWEGFIASLQVNWRWDNTPSPGFERSDTLYLLTLGYEFEI